MNNFKTLRGLFSFSLLVMCVCSVVFAFAEIHYSYNDSLSRYEESLNIGVKKVLDEYFLTSSAKDVSDGVARVSSLFPEINYVDFNNVDKAFKGSDYELNFLERVVYYGYDLKKRDFTSTDRGLVAEYEYSLELFYEDNWPNVLSSFLWMFVFVLGSGISYLVSLSVIRPIVRVRDAAMAVADGGGSEVNVNRRDEIGTISTFFNEVTKSLDSVSSDLDERNRLKGEVDLAAKIQKNLIPEEIPRVEALDIAAKTKSAAEVGGDIFDFIGSSDHMRFFIGDATGHGVPAGLVMTMTDVLIHSLTVTRMPIDNLLAEMNEVLFDRTDRSMFITLILFHYDVLMQQFTYCGAGHEQILVYRADASEVEVIVPGGIAMGMFPDVSKHLKVGTLELSDGDSIMVFTDGLAEAKNLNGDLYGIDRIVEAFKLAAKRDTANKILSVVKSRFDEFIDYSSYQQEDDISIMIIKKPRQDEVLGLDLMIDGDRSTNW